MVLDFFPEMMGTLVDFGGWEAEEGLDVGGDLVKLVDELDVMRPCVGVPASGSATIQRAEDSKDIPLVESWRWIAMITPPVLVGRLVVGRALPRDLGVPISARVGNQVVDRVSLIRVELRRWSGVSICLLVGDH